MNPENVVKHLRVLWRTDRMIADIKMQHLLAGFGLRAFAALIALFGLLMLELSASQADPEHLSALAVSADSSELAREPGHPEDDAAVGYVIIAPLDAKDRIDARLWRTHRDACRIARIRPNEDDALGHLVHRRGGGWAFHYDADVEVPDEVGVHVADERLVLGEYVSIKEGGKTHTYGVVAVSHL